MASSEFDQAWKSDKASIVLDAYEFTPIKWPLLKKNRNLVGFINKASDGLPPKYCGGQRDTHCRTKWRRYAVTKELYHTRRALAKALGLKWGAYHLARAGNPIPGDRVIATYNAVHARPPRPALWRRAPAA